MNSKSAFKPAWWLNSCHVQTIYPALFRQAVAPESISRQRLTTPDGDFLDLDWCELPDKPLVILLHGLAGSSKSGYIKGLQKALLNVDFASVTVNFRGCSGELNLRARSYHSGETEDIDFVYQHLRQRFPHRPMMAVGFSLGGNVLLKWLGEQGEKVDLSAAVAVSVPFQLNLCATKLDKGFSKLYRDYLLRELKQYIIGKQQYLQQLGLAEEVYKLNQLGSLKTVRSFWQYDHQVVAQLHGFADAADYYQRSSAKQFLTSIRVPTLLIQAADDPFMTADVVPNPSQLPANLRLELCENGGHVGFVSQPKTKIFGADYWLDQRIPQFLSQHRR
jgi:predicted alpha/beta-fold hydrolase